jgi:uncharacterized repeat protein (TIGR03803 family)
VRKFFVTTVICTVSLFLLAAATTAFAQTLTTLHNFTGADGDGPAASMILARDGNFYGTTFLGGSQEGGTIFRTTPSGSFSVFYNFCSQSQCHDGSSPEAGLVQGSDGNFYGAAGNGGSGESGDGTAFKVASNGTLTVLHNFCTLSGCADGAGPESTPIQGTDGNFYGTTIYAGSGLGGVVYKVSSSGSFSVLYSSDPAHGSILNGVIQGADGNLYVTADTGGANGVGTVFKVTPSGSATVLYNFCSQSDCTDGSSPNAGLIEGSDGNFYGTTLNGGINNQGTIFKITSSGTLTVLHSFTANDGGGPTASLFQGADGNFYGTAYNGGANGAGVIFGMTPSGSYTLLHSFAGTDGSHPRGGLVQAPNGSFYGTTFTGGSHNMGTVFQLTIPLIPTTTALTTAPNPSYQGESVTMTATVTAQNGSTPAGTVVFKSNGTSVGSATLDNSGVAVLNYSGLSAGTDNITAVYQGSVTLAGSTSNTVVQVVLPASMTTVTSTPNPSAPGQDVTITATVGPAGPPTPTGTVGFTSNGSAISGCTSVTLSSSRTAVCATSALPVGTDTIVATYSGDSNYGPSSGTDIQIVNPVPVAWQFVTLAPCRIVDTRNPNGTFGGPAIPANTARAFPLAQSGNPCNIPSDAVAYSLNVTAVPITTLSYLTIWPTGEGQPVVSTLNSLDGRIKANAAIIPAGISSGSVSVFVTNTTNVVLDINGYFIPSSSSTLAFYPVTPCRVVDTRNPNGPLGGPYLTHGVERDFPLLESSCIPSGTDVKAYSLNFTVVPKTSAGVAYLTVWPQGLSKPLVSTLNDLTNTIVANAAIVPAGTGGEGGVATYASNDTDLVIDINGYFAAPATGGLSFYALTPCRVIDTRKVGNGQPFTGELTVNVQTSPCGPPATSAGYVFNATVVPSGALGYLTLWPDTENRPVVSTLNALDGSITSNMAIVPNLNGKTDAFAQGTTQLILDISGYFAP